MENEKKIKQNIIQIGINIKKARKDYKDERTAMLMKKRKKNFNDLNIGLTQEELARKVGVSTNSISLIELGKTTLSLPKILQICKALNISLFDIFKDTSYIYTKAPTDLFDKYEQLNKHDKKIVEALINYLYKEQRISDEEKKRISANFQEKY